MKKRIYIEPWISLLWSIFIVVFIFRLFPVPCLCLFFYYYYCLLCFILFAIFYVVFHSVFFFICFFLILLDFFGGRSIFICLSFAFYNESNFCSHLFLLSFNSFQHHFPIFSRSIWTDTYILYQPCIIILISITIVVIFIIIIISIIIIIINEDAPLLFISTSEFWNRKLI